MHERYPNLYKRARCATRLTQEGAAELLDISVESIKQYEGGRRVPPDEVVARMAEVYRLPWLTLEHAKATDTLGVLPSVEVKPLPAATLTLANRLRGAADQLTELMMIAEDGRIDEDERPAFDRIVDDLREIIAAMYQVIYAPGTKKDRPEADTSGRSCSGNKARNDCNYSVTQPGGNVKPLSREART